MPLSRYPPELSSRLVDLLVEAVCVVDAEGRFVFVSAAGQEVFGRSEAQMLGAGMQQFLHPDDVAVTVQAAEQVMGGTPLRNFHNRYLRPDGSVVDLLWSARWFESERLRVALARDITELKQAERTQAALYALSQSAHDMDALPELLDALQRTLLALLPTAQLQVALLDEEDRLQLSSPEQASALGDLGAAHQHPRIAEVLARGEPLQFRERASGRPWLGVPLKQRTCFGALILQGAPNAADFTAREFDLLRFAADQLSTAIERKRAEQRLRHQASHDGLTGLPNRMHTLEQLRLALQRAHREGQRLAVMYLDLDGFKQINDRLGHPAGDALLQCFAQRIRQSVRAEDFVGRMGGDEFVVLLAPLRLPEQAEAIADQLLQRLREPLRIESQQAEASSSIGLAVYPDDALDADSLIAVADAAMYRAKAAGGARVCAAALRSPG